MECLVEGFFKLKVFWVKDGEVIDFNRRVLVNEDWKVIIKNICVLDMGIYVCEVKSVIGEMIEVLFVYVWGNFVCCWI